MQKKVYAECRGWYNLQGRDLDCYCFANDLVLKMTASSWSCCKLVFGACADSRSWLTIWIIETEFYVWALAFANASCLHLRKCSCRLFTVCIIASKSFFLRAKGIFYLWSRIISQWSFVHLPIGIINTASIIGRLAPVVSHHLSQSRKTCLSCTSLNHFTPFTVPGILHWVKMTWWRHYDLLQMQRLAQLDKWPNNLAQPIFQPGDTDDHNASEATWVWAPIQELLFKWASLGLR